MQNCMSCVISDLAPFLSQMSFYISPMIAALWPNLKYPGVLWVCFFFFLMFPWSTEKLSVQGGKAASAGLAAFPLPTQHPCLHGIDEVSPKHLNSRETSGSESCRAVLWVLPHTCQSVHGYGQNPQLHRSWRSTYYSSTYQPYYDLPLLP